MDRIDAKIINTLQENARCPLKDLAAEVFLSSPAVSARIEKIEAQGIIKSYSAIMDNEKLGFHITAFVNLELSPKQKDDFYPFISNCPNVVECNCITGNFSILMKVVFHTTQELDSFIGELQVYGNTSTQIVFSTPVPARQIKMTAVN